MSASEQSNKLTGYVVLSEAEINLLKEIKAQGTLLGDLVAGFRANPDLDQRWVSIGATDLQTGLMALLRAVAKSKAF